MAHKLTKKQALAVQHLWDAHALLSGKPNAKNFINSAIDAIQQADRTEPTNFEYDNLPVNARPM